MQILWNLWIFGGDGTLRPIWTILLCSYRISELCELVSNVNMGIFPPIPSHSKCTIYIVHVKFSESNEIILMTPCSGSEGVCVCVAIKRPRKRESFTTGGKKNPEHLQRLHPGPSDMWIVYYSLYTFLENILHIGWFFNPKQQTNCMKTTNRCSG